MSLSPAFPNRKKLLVRMLIQVSFAATGVAGESAVSRQTLMARAKRERFIID
jgi:hypothetical protein